MTREEAATGFAQALGMLVISASAYMASPMEKAVPFQKEMRKAEAKLAAALLVLTAPAPAALHVCMCGQGFPSRADLDEHGKIVMSWPIGQHTP